MAIRPRWADKALRSLVTSSYVNLKGEHIDDLSWLGQPPVISGLDLSFCQLSTIVGLKPLPQLTTLIADGSQLSNFSNFATIPNLRRLSLLWTPVSSAPHFVLSALLVCRNIATLNGKQISLTQRQRADEYSRTGPALVNAGWLAEFPCPSADRLEELAAQFRIVRREVSVNKRSKTAKGLAASSGRRNSAMVRRARQRSVRMPEIEVSEVETAVSGEEEGINDRPTLQRIADVLRQHHIEVDDADLCPSVIRAIDGLCAETKAKRRK
jgi:Leucine-rich repeat (LRR) protein